MFFTYLENTKNSLETNGKKPVKIAGFSRIKTKYPIEKRKEMGYSIPGNLLRRQTGDSQGKGGIAYGKDSRGGTGKAVCWYADYGIRQHTV